jgi:hypothetical protein
VPFIFQQSYQKLVCPYPFVCCLTRSGKQRILRLLPIKHRLTCSSVNHSFYRAAAAATKELCYSTAPTASSDIKTCFWHWMEKHGDHLLRLHLSFWGAAGEDMVGWLPCQHLSALQLHCCHVQLAANSNAPGLLQSCAGLQRLVLRDCRIVGSSSYEALKTLSKLQHLELHCYQPCRSVTGHAAVQHSAAAVDYPHTPSA